MGGWERTSSRGMRPRRSARLGPPLQDQKVVLWEVGENGGLRRHKL